MFNVLHASLSILLRVFFQNLREHFFFYIICLVHELNQHLSLSCLALLHDDITPIIALRPVVLCAAALPFKQ